MSLFQRITQKKNFESEHESLIRSLNNILNSKRDYSCYLHKYGIGDFSHYSDSQQLIDAVIEEIKENIALYEPRVDIIEVEALSNVIPFRIAFRMNCTLKNSHQSIEMVFDSLWNKFTVNHFNI